MTENESSTEIVSRRGRHEAGMATSRHWATQADGRVRPSSRSTAATSPVLCRRVGDLDTARGSRRVETPPLARYSERLDSRRLYLVAGGTLLRVAHVQLEEQHVLRRRV
jgi:hypothetical protein